MPPPRSPDPATSDRWDRSDVPRGTAYDRRFADLAAAGMDVHGEAALVDHYGPGLVLDAGCGTGRVAIELARLGHPVVGVDVDPSMLDAARDKAPDLTWILGDLTDSGLAFDRAFDVVVMAGNVLLFVPAGTEEQVIANAARWLAPGGRLIVGYSLVPGGFDVAAQDRAAARSGLELEARWSTWGREPFTPGDDYAVSVHRLVGSQRHGRRETT